MTARRRISVYITIYFKTTRSSHLPKYMSTSVTTEEALHIFTQVHGSLKIEKVHTINQSSQPLTNHVFPTTPPSHFRQQHPPSRRPTHARTLRSLEFLLNRTPTRGQSSLRQHIMASISLSQVKLPIWRRAERREKSRGHGGRR